MTGLKNSGGLNYH